MEWIHRQKPTRIYLHIYIVIQSNYLVRFRWTRDYYTSNGVLQGEDKFQDNKVYLIVK